MFHAVSWRFVNKCGIRTSLHLTSPQPPPTFIIHVYASIENNSKNGDIEAAVVPPGPGYVSVKLRAAACTSVDLRSFSRAPPPDGSDSSSPGSPPFSPRIGGSEGVFEVTATGDGVSELQRGDLVIPALPRIIPGNIHRDVTPAGNVPGTGPATSSETDSGNDSGNGSEVRSSSGNGSRTNHGMSLDSEAAVAGDGGGTWRSTAVLTEASLLRVPPAGAGDGVEVAVAVEPDVAAHVSTSMATAVRILADFGPATRELGKGDRVVFTGAYSAVAQVHCSFIVRRNTF